MPLGFEDGLARLTMMKRRSIVAGMLVLTTLAATLVCAQKAAGPDRNAVRKTMQNGNWKDAYDGFSKLALDPSRRVLSAS